ncbi:hypothetical protein BCU84_08560 [Shewanella sp. 10N.286.51.B7]|uniref:hypothetical protein n=1 Tax=Shewanella sp. 10N.286.51.B7 TaxID=1880836 RepID=UPI000C85E64F|nr:hypothetical protein [Shewanella sp. 10N.286.51.B7]PMG78104.1 hypothetical protein BCU84_08560 [Shewanella sp. 10N.286.51.B7]
MPKISFNFFCHRDIPLYADLCNSYLADNRFDFTVGHNINNGQIAQHAQFTPIHTYFIEVEASQSELAQLADEIAAKFLYSIWLKSAEVIAIDVRKGTKTCLQHQAVHQGYCSECEPLISNLDNSLDKDLYKGLNKEIEIAVPCPHCLGERNLKQYEIGFNHQDISNLVNRILQGEEVWIDQQENSLSLSLNPIITNQTTELHPNLLELSSLQQVLITHPAVISSSFIIKQHQSLALSSFEKPFLKLAPNKKSNIDRTELNQDLNESYYNVTFADSRLLIRVAALLKRQKIDWLYIKKPQNNLSVSWVNNVWVQNQTTTNLNFKAPMPKHDDNRYLQGNLTYNVSWQKNTLKCIVTESNETLASSLIQHKPLQGIDAATCALHAGLLNTGCVTSINSSLEASSSLKKLACIYLSNSQSSSVITQNQQGEISSFLQMPTLPQSGQQLIEELVASDKNTIFNKYCLAYPEVFKLLADFTLTSGTQADSLQSFMAYAALIVLPDEEVRKNGPSSPFSNAPVANAPVCNAQELADIFHALAQSYHGNNAPRVDFPLCAINSEDNNALHKRSINWRKTLASLMSFKLAGANPAILAFGFFDSLTDYLSNWIDHLEQEQGIDAVVLAGNDFSYEVMANRLCIRLGKNYPLVVNRQLDLEGANIAVGGLYLAKRRR